jgi:hypothetical protein
VAEDVHQEAVEELELKELTVEMMVEELTEE